MTARSYSFTILHPINNAETYCQFSENVNTPKMIDCSKMKTHRKGRMELQEPTTDIKEYFRHNRSLRRPCSDSPQLIEAVVLLAQTFLLTYIDMQII